MTIYGWSLQYLKIFEFSHMEHTTRCPVGFVDFIAGGFQQKLILNKVGVTPRASHSLSNWNQVNAAQIIQSLCT